MSEMILKAAIEMGGECSLGITKEEWDKMSESEQRDVINDYQPNVVDLWVEEE